MSFSEKFRAARLEKKLTQQQVADELKIDRSAIAHYENGRSKPHFDLMCAKSVRFLTLHMRICLMIK